MPTLRVQIDVQWDGNSISGFPYTRSITTDKAQQLDQLIAASGTQHNLANLIATLQLLLVRALDQPVTIQLNSAASAVLLNPGGLLLLLDCNQAGDSASDKNTVLNTGTVTGEITGLAGGS